MLGPDYQSPESTKWQAGTAPARANCAPAADYRQWWDNLHDPVLSLVLEGAAKRIRCQDRLVADPRPRLSSASLKSLLGPQATVAQASCCKPADPAMVTAVPAAAMVPGSISAGNSDFWGQVERSIEAADANYFATLAPV